MMLLVFFLMTIRRIQAQATDWMMTTIAAILFLQTMTTKKTLFLHQKEYDSEDNNDIAEASDASGRYITNTTTALFTSKSGVESWAAEPLLPLTSKTSQRNIIRKMSGLTRYAIRMSGSL